MLVKSILLRCVKLPLPSYSDSLETVSVLSFARESLINQNFEYLTGGSRYISIN